MPRPQRLFRKGEIIELTIQDMAFGGKAIGRIPTDQGDFTVFVQNGIPGQVVKARVIKCKKSHAECKLEAVITPSPDEKEIPFQEIPGAPYARLPIEKQHEYKKRTTLELFKRIGGIKDIESVFDEFIPSPEQWHYRNKMEYSFSEIRWDLDTLEDADDFGLGFKHRGTWWKVENLDRDSGLFDKEFEDKLKDIRGYLEKTGFPAWHPPQRKGFYRFLVARKSIASQKILINLVTTSDNLEQFDTKDFVAFLTGLLGDRIAGILHTINDETGDRTESRDGKSTVIFGDLKIEEEILGLRFEMAMGSFFQTNPQSAARLYSKALEYVGQSGDQVVLDLFCGTGTITQLLARLTGNKIVGVDLVKSAIEDAKANTRINNISGVQFIAADVGKFLLEYPEYEGTIHTIVMDPPRAGIAPKTLRKVIRLGANRIVYISCNPATQSRDAATLAEEGYKLRKISLCDQFPHTAHIETIALFEKDEP